MERSDWQRKFREGFTGKKESKKKYEDMSREEKEKYLRERNKKQSFSGFQDGGLVEDEYGAIQELLAGQQPMMSEEIMTPEVTQDDVVEAELAQINEEAKSPFQQTKPERAIASVKEELEKTPQGQAIEKSPQDEMINKYKSLMDKYEKKLDAPQKEYGVMDALPDILTGLYNVDVRAKGGLIPEMKMPNSIQKRREQDRMAKQDNLGGLEKLQSMYNNYMNLQKKQSPKQLNELDKAKIETEKAKAEKLKKEASQAEPSWEEKERKRFEFKEKLQTEKEKREALKQTRDTETNLDSQIEKVRRAKKLLKNLVKESTLTDTGPLDQYVAGTSPEGQLLKQAFNDLSLDKMTKMFKGMSKAIDSDAERKMFEQSQASLSNYPNVNMQMLDNMEKGFLSLKNKNSSLRQELEGMESEQSQSPYGDEVERNGKKYKWNPAVGKYQLIKG